MNTTITCGILCLFNFAVGVWLGGYIGRTRRKFKKVYGGK